MLRDAIERFPFDTVMFPLNPIQAADPRPATDYRPLVAAALARGTGMIGIKATALGPWRTRAEQTYTTWYRPSDDPADAALRLRFALTHPIATAVLPSDTRLWPALFDAAESFEPLGDDEIESMVRDARGSEPLYVESMKLSLPAYRAPRDRRKTMMDRVALDRFFRDRRVGVLAIPRDGRAPLTHPVWYEWDGTRFASRSTPRARRRSSSAPDRGRYRSPSRARCRPTATPSCTARRRSATAAIRRLRTRVARRYFRADRRRPVRPAGDEGTDAARRRCG